jgi:hypothetical protein
VALARRDGYQTVLPQAEVDRRIQAILKAMLKPCCTGKTAK